MIHWFCKEELVSTAKTSFEKQGGINETSRTNVEIFISSGHVEAILYWTKGGGGSLETHLG